MLAIYGLEVGMFGEGELELIGKLADNLAYGIGRIRDAKNLALNESRLRAAERLTHVGHWEWDLQSDHFDFLADEMFSIYGVVPSEWTRSPEIFLSFVDETERQLVEDVFRDAIRNGSAAVAHHITRPNGEVRSVRIRAEAIHDDDGRPVRLLGTVQDITEYLEAKIQLAQSQQFLLAITDNMAEGMIATDSDGIITFANTAAGTLLHTSARDLVGRATNDVFGFRQDASGEGRRESPRARVERGPLSDDRPRDVDPTRRFQRSGCPECDHRSGTRIDTARSSSLRTSPIVRRPNCEWNVNSRNWPGSDVSATPSTTIASCCTPNRSSTSPRTTWFKTSC